MWNPKRALPSRFENLDKLPPVPYRKPSSCVIRPAIGCWQRSTARPGGTNAHKPLKNRQAPEPNRPNLRLEERIAWIYLGYEKRTRAVPYLPRGG